MYCFRHFLLARSIIFHAILFNTNKKIKGKITINSDQGHMVNNNNHFLVKKKNAILLLY
jgi:hypothetical protein